MPRRKLFKKRKNLNLLLSDDMVRRIDAAVEEGETRTSFLRWCIDIGLKRREAQKGKAGPHK
jgi:hypothetical protein